MAPANFKKSRLVILFFMGLESEISSGICQKKPYLLNNFLRRKSIIGRYYICLYAVDFIFLPYVGMNDYC
jgi:hypothetical protein